MHIQCLGDFIIVMYCMLIYIVIISRRKGVGKESNKRKIFLKHFVR